MQSISFSLFVLLVLCGFHIMHPIPLISLFLHICPLHSGTPCKREENKCHHHHHQSNKQKPKNILLWKAQHVTVSHTLYPFAHTTLLANFHYSQPLGWFEASSFCDINNIVSSPGLLLVNLLLRRVMEVLQLWFNKTGPLFCVPAIHR